LNPTTRDTPLVDNTPIDYLDFASPASGLGSKMGLDGPNKWPGETSREWGQPKWSGSGKPWVYKQNRPQALVERAQTATKYIALNQ
jgi:hypothetical protein